jgi:Fe-S oxidoreductase
VYHDPCYLARGANLSSLPHRLGNQLWADGIALPPDNGLETFCCGAGGGAMWLHESGERINRQRAEQLTQCGAQTAATACPYCIAMLEDGLSDKQPQPMPVVDLVEALEWASR